MKTSYYTASSLDGFIADADHSLDWLFQFTADVGTFAEFIQGVGALAMGSTTYEWIIENHIEREGAAWPYDVPAWVFSSRELPRLPNADIRFVSGEVVPVHAAMREAAGGRNLWIVGGGDLAGQFYDQRLLDEITLTLASVTLGGGAPLFPRRTHPPLQLTTVTQVGTDFAELTYRVVYGDEME